MTIAERLRAVREATRLTQSDFARALDSMAERTLGPARIRYDQPLISILERGGRTVTLDDVAVYAAIDPLQRGKLWLGWDEAEDPAMRRRQGPSVIKEPPEEIFDQPIAAKKPKRRRA